MVSDSAKVRDILTRYLIGHAMVAMPTHDAAQALAVCETVSPHALVVDLAAPDADRLALIRHVKSSRASRALVVALADSGEAEEAALCRENGADHVLSKPVDLDALHRILAASAEHRTSAVSPSDPPPSSAAPDDGGYC